VKLLLLTFSEFLSNLLSYLNLSYEQTLDPWALSRLPWGLEICVTHLVALQALSCGEKLRPILVLKKHGGGGETKSARPEAGMMILEPSKH